jgi:SAM-dependent methyltransferase
VPPPSPHRHAEQIALGNRVSDQGRRRGRWYETSPTTSLALLTEAGLTADSAVVDIGGGASGLPGALVEIGVRRLTVVDVSGAALAKAREQLGQMSASVIWLEADVTTLVLPQASIDLWHDRADFHFLTDPADRARYVALAARSLRPGGAVVIGTFALDGPPRCSGLPVAQYGAEGLTEVFGPEFQLRRAMEETHTTPTGTEQRFTWAVIERV